MRPCSLQLEYRPLRWGDEREGASAVTACQIVCPTCHNYGRSGEVFRTEPNSSRVWLRRVGLRRHGSYRMPAMMLLALQTCSSSVCLSPLSDLLLRCKYCRILSRGCELTTTLVSRRAHDMTVEERRREDSSEANAPDPQDLYRRYTQHLAAYRWISLIGLVVGCLLLIGLFVSTLLQFH